MLRLVFAGAFGRFTRYRDKAFVDFQYFGIFIRPRYCLQGKPPVRRAFGVALHLDAKIVDFLNRQIRPLGGTLFETSVFLIKTLQKLGVFQHGCPHFLQLGIFNIFLVRRVGNRRYSQLKSK